MGERRIVQVCGRWSRLETGDLVTPVPPFRDFGFDKQRFADAVKRFQSDPEGVLAADGAVQIVKAWRRAATGSSE
jgi:hypothetical protein